MHPADLFGRRRSQPVVQISNGRIFVGSNAWASKLTTSFGRGDVKSSLKLGVQDIEKTIGEAPEKEENCHQGDWQNGLLDSESRGPRQAPVGD